jgi:uncharacterized protein (TIGR03435 family)
MRPLILVLVVATSQLADPSTPVFQTSSVKTSAADASVTPSIRLLPGGVFRATNATLRELIGFAYQRHTFDQREVKNGPAWIDTDRFDIEGHVAGEHVLDANGVPQTGLMLRALLNDRFKLKVRQENEQRPVYLLTRVTGTSALGPQLRPSQFDCSWVLSNKPPTVPPGQSPPCSMKTPPGRLFANTVTMPTLASLLSQHTDRDVVDTTGLTGRYDIELESSDLKAPAGYTPGPSDLALPPAAGPPLSVAVQQQLGLKLEPSIAGVPVVIVDAAERPIPN